MPGISYDESGSLASYFGITFLAAFLFPATYIVFRPPKRDALKPLCNCTECQTARQSLSKRKSSDRTRRFARRILPLLLGWILFLYFSYNISQTPRTPGGTVYNPFEILGLSDTTGEKGIKKHYKKLSLQFHPDKIKLAINQTKEDADAKFVELTKAYKSLNDEVTRENLAKYGNPDGPQQREDKIAIPQWVVEGKNGIWVLGAYGLVLGGGIPYVVGRWWFSQRLLTRDGILNNTAEIFFHQLREDTDFTSLIALLASALEFNALLGSKKKAGKKERKERQAKLEELEKEVEQRRVELDIADSAVMRKESKVEVSTAVARRAKALLWAHLLRIKLDPEWENEQYTLLRNVQPILNALSNISLSHNWLNTSLLVAKLQPCLVQALPADVSPLAQLPGITPELADEYEITKGAEGKKWLERWAKSDSAKEMRDAKIVAESWPRLEVVDAEFRVVGEKVVTPSSIVQLAFSCRYIHPSTPSSIKAVPPKPKLLPNGDSHDEKTEPLAGVEDETLAEKVNGITKEVVEKAVGRKGKVDEKKLWAANGYAHAPRWPQLRKPHYQVLLGDTKLDRIIVQPTRISDIPLPRSDGLPSEPREFTLQFQAPPQANLYSFVLFACSDTFLGCDVSLPVMLRVVEPPEDDSESDDGDISDPDEDTLAGQMAMMRGGKVRPSGVHGEDDDEESEGEYESSSDEDTPRGGRAINEDSDSDSD